MESAFILALSAAAGSLGLAGLGYSGLAAVVNNPVLWNRLSPEVKDMLRNVGMNGDI